FEIGPKKSHHDGVEDTPFQRGEAWPVFGNGESKKNRRSEFHKEITDTDRLRTVPAAPAQNSVAEYGHVVIPGDGAAAFRTKRARRNDGQIARQAIYANVEKAAEKQAEDCR